MLKSKASNTNATKPRKPMRAATRSLTMRVAFQGDRGAYAESAISEIWRHPVERIPVPTFTGAVRAVADGDADACVIPIENSIVGRVEAGWQALAAYQGLRTVGEALVPVRHCLVAPNGATLDGLRAAASHPGARAQGGDSTRCEIHRESRLRARRDSGEPGREPLLPCATLGTRREPAIPHRPVQRSSSRLESRTHRPRRRRRRGRRR